MLWSKIHSSDGTQECVLREPPREQAELRKPTFDTQLPWFLRNISTWLDSDNWVLYEWPIIVSERHSKPSPTFTQTVLLHFRVVLPLFPCHYDQVLVTKMALKPPISSTTSFQLSGLNSKVQLICRVENTKDFWQWHLHYNSIVRRSAQSQTNTIKTSYNQPEPCQKTPCPEWVQCNTFPAQFCQFLYTSKRSIHK